MRHTSRSISSDDCPITSKIRRRISTTPIPRPIPTNTLMPTPIPVFPSLFNPFPFISNPSIPPPVSLNFPHSPLLNPTTTIIRQPIQPFVTPLPAVLTQRIRQLPQPGANEQPIGTRTRRKATKIWKPYDIKS
ncbi:hypothetical protein LOAG_15598 [Loa loa]|nr:hypothetical protein LOAG_15598 [Loa loa]EFO12933.1 hypothetical protein LOAG_15598 [Loa loa]